MIIKILGFIIIGVIAGILFMAWYINRPIDDKGTECLLLFALYHICTELGNVILN